MIRRLAGLFALLALLSACSPGSGSDEAKPPDETAASSTPKTTPESELEGAVRAYSKAFLGGDGKKAYALLSERCQDSVALTDFAAITEDAKQTYGTLSIKSIDVEIDGNRGTATYSYPVKTINQTDEPWVNERGWKNNDC